MVKPLTMIACLVVPQFAIAQFQPGSIGRERTPFAGSTAEDLKKCDAFLKPWFQAMAKANSELIGTSPDYKAAEASLLEAIKIGSAMPNGAKGSVQSHVRADMAKATEEHVKIMKTAAKYAADRIDRPENVRKAIEDNRKNDSLRARVPLRRIATLMTGDDDYTLPYAPNEKKPK